MQSLDVRIVVGCSAAHTLIFESRHFLSTFQSTRLYHIEMTRCVDACCPALMSLPYRSHHRCHCHQQHHGNDDIWYVFMIFWIFTEPFRLAFGWTGNLRESVPNLFLFVLLTIIPQTPAQMYLASFQKDVTAFDMALGTVSVAFLVLEIVVGIHALLRLLHAQAERYYIEEKQAEKDAIRNVKHPRDEHIMRRVVQSPRVS